MTAPSKAFENVVDEVIAAAPRVADGFADGRAYDGVENPSGQEVLAADIRANRLLKERITSLDGVGEFVSEEEEGVIDCGSGVGVAVDPLDGSSNLVTNNIVGIIVGVYDASLPCAGTELVGAAYVVFGPLTTCVVADGETVVEYVVEEKDGRGERVDARELSLPEPTVYGLGGGRENWTDGFASFADEVERELKLRYGGSMVGDVNQVLHKGGVFAYPALRDRPEGKLRTVFEGAPMAYIVEAAGGASSDGERSLLEREPDGVHDRTPVYLGNASLIERLEERV
ncbi:MAG: class 1 fructose-bisphosphatase [Halobacteriales archaeon]